MKKLKSLLALLLALCLAVTCFVGCSDTKDDDDDDEDEEVVEEVEETEPEEEEEEPQTDIQQVTGTFSDCLMLEKIGTVDRDNFSTYSGGLVYKDSETGKYGIISPEGLVDSGALYEVVSGEDFYFAVMTKKAANYNDIAGLNTFALVDGYGRQIVGPEYAAYSIRGDFVIAYKATEVDQENGDLYFYSESAAFETKNTDTIRYACNWVAYNAKTGEKLAGVEGNGGFSGYEAGDFLTYHDGIQYVHIHLNGTFAPEGADVFEDGSYAVEGQIGEVFDSNGTKLFAYDLTGYIPDSTDGENYIAKRYMDGKTTYVVMDKTGKVISTEFEDYITLQGNLVLCEKVLMNFQGEVLLEGNCDSVKVDRMFGQYYIARNGDVYTMIDDTGAVYLSLEDDDVHTIYTDDFVACSKASGENMYYNHKTQSYDIKGYSMSPWLVKVEGANSTYELVDSMTGDVMLSGYSNYSYNARNPETYYVYAKYNGGAEVYLATSMNGFKSVTEKKENLMDDLSAAFEAEGLAVTVNRETGELAMDSSVLFGGDSSELTAEGKEFLNKFIKAYNSVAFSAKYEGFITKTMIEGHTAPVSGSTYASGLGLSQERAANVKAYILSGETGVDLSAKADSFEDVGYSNSQPVYNADGTVNMDASRRVSFRFLVNVNG